MLAFVIALAPMARGQTFEHLYSFSGIDGYGPFATLVSGMDGNLYGTTIIGGEYDEGTIFRFSTNGELKTLISFNFENGPRT